MNVICISGNLGKDAEQRFLPSGEAVANFSVADNMGKEKGAIFWNCTLFGKRAESLTQYLKKGTPVTVTGVAVQREWTDKEGNKRRELDVRVNDIALQGGKQEARQESAPAQQRQAPAPVSSFEDDLPW